MNEGVVAGQPGVAGDDLAFHRSPCSRVAVGHQLAAPEGLGARASQTHFPRSYRVFR